MKIRLSGEATPKITQQIPAQTKIAQAPAQKTNAERSPFRKLIEGLGKEINAGESLMKKAIGAGGTSMEPGELLALQAGVYRYGEAVDLASKLIDRASTGVKTIVNGGGQ